MGKVQKSSNPECYTLSYNALESVRMVSLCVCFPGSPADQSTQLGHLSHYGNRKLQLRPV
jgi:hypothetical protein